MISGIKRSSGIGMLVILIVLCISPATKAQEISKFDLEERADHYFQQQRYDKATADYEVLHTMYPKDAQYAYCLGRCYLHTNRYLEEACELLKFSATRNFGEDAYFYLGQAYHLNYSFEDATLSYLTFKKTASGRAMKKFDVDYYLQQAIQAKQAVELAQNLEVTDMSVVSAHAREKAFPDRLPGRYLYVPDEFKSEQDKETGYATLMFYPENTKVGDYVFFSSLSKKGKHGSDLYRAQRVSDEGYSIPEALPAVLNTDYDEDYPYFDKLSSSLYFSSKGHTTSGGYDIFRSRYDPVAGTWSSPEKLAFPINSVLDDVLYTPTGKPNEFIFLTNRNSEVSEYDVCTISLVNAGDFVSLSDRDEVVNMAMLSPNGISISQPLMTSAEPEHEAGLVIEEASSVSEKDPYSLLVEQALHYQAESDSLDTEVRTLRRLVQGEDNYQKKQELIASMTTLDKEAKRMQRLADGKFDEAEALRNPGTRQELAKAPEDMTPHSTPSGITLYTYNTESPAVAEPEPKKEVTRKAEARKEETYAKGYEAAKSMSAGLAASFSIMNSSPYSNNNPIPVAAIPGGLVYRIQLGAYTQEIPENTFGGLSPVSKEQASSATRYYVGVFGSVAEARKALEEVKAYGYPDAFLVSFFDKNKISVQEAREIEFSDR
ncbi:MAG: hypothetical protein JW801_11885 [Bacteroidales bacterium]|nr:hypothetical protein [Bacteroidales bacterium]